MRLRRMYLVNLKSLDLRDPISSDTPAPVGVFPGACVVAAVAVIAEDVTVSGGGRVCGVVAVG